jgi:phage shock protein C
MISGVLGGAAEYLGDIDPTLLRLAFVFLTIVTGFIPGVAVYIVAVMIVPEAPGAGNADPAVTSSGPSATSEQREETPIAAGVGEEN